MYQIVNSADALIGNTPLMELKGIEKAFGLNAKILAKLESFNPAGSIKDRVAKQMIDDAFSEGKISAGATVIEPTSGNTGIGLALVCKARGLKAVIVMPDTMSVERRKIIAAYGAKLVLTDGKLGMRGAIEKAEELHKEIENSIIAGQFENPSNPKAHYLSTAPEIFAATNGEFDYFVAGVGTGGTISGVGKYIKERNKNIKVIAVEPSESAVISGKSAGSHGIQGIGAGFIPKNFDNGVIDGVLPVPTKSAYEFARAVSDNDRILVGISSGAALAAAVTLAKKAENEGKTFVVIFPDSGERYFSTTLFDN
ncbi:MAG: cysteine synthase A [Clostridia bacterium]|nr:cysteine synthase A [Clostridia bacterium]